MRRTHLRCQRTSSSFVLYAARRYSKLVKSGVTDVLSSVSYGMRAPAVTLQNVQYPVGWKEMATRKVSASSFFSIDVWDSLRRDS
jgi:hypothetical protein